MKIILSKYEKKLTCSLFRLEFQSKAVSAALTNIPPELNIIISKLSYSHAPIPVVKVFVSILVV